MGNLGGRDSDVDGSRDSGNGDGLCGDGPLAGAVCGEGHETILVDSGLTGLTGLAGGLGDAPLDPLIEEGAGTIEGGNAVLLAGNSAAGGDRGRARGGKGSERGLGGSEHKRIDEGRRAVDSPHMVELVPVQALRVVDLGELIQHIVDLEPLLVHDDRLDRGKGGVLRRRDTVAGVGEHGGAVDRIIGKQHVETVKLALIESEAVDADMSAEPVGAVDVERLGENVNVGKGVEVSRGDSIDAADLTEVLVACGGVVGGHEAELGGRGLDILDHGLCGRLVHGSGSVAVGETAAQRDLRNDVLHHNELVIVGRGVQAVDDTGDKVRNAVQGRERLTKLLLTDGDRVLRLEVHSVEHAVHVGLVASEHGGLRVRRIEGVSVGDIYEDFLDRLAELKDTFLGEGPRVRVHAGSDDDSRNAVDQRRNELIHARLESGDSLTYSTDALGRVHRCGDGLVVFQTGVVSDSVDNADAAGIEATSVGHTRHG